MEMAMVLGQQVLVMLIYLLVGVAAAKAKIITAEQSKGMSSMLLYILSPCMLLKAFKMDYQPEKFTALLFSGFVSLLAALILILSAKYIFYRKKNELTPIERSTVPYTNSGYLAIPLISATLGNEAVFYSCGFLLVFNFFVWTHCLYQMSSGRAKVQLKSFIYNPNLIAIIVGLILFRFNIKLPSVVDSAVSGFGSMVAPVALFIIGVTLADESIKTIFFSKRAYWVCFVRLILAPLLLILIFRIISISTWVPDGSLIINTILIMSYAPVAVIITMFAQHYDQKVGYASQLVSLSTILSIVSMPLMLLVAQMVL